MNVGRCTMKKVDLEREIARLESMNDLLMAELAYVDELLKESGFARGLASLKEVAEEMLESGEGVENEEE